MTEALLETARRLLRAGGDPSGARALALCREELAELAFRCVDLEEAGVLLARRGRSPRLLLAGHVDVVPVTGDWTVDPRKGVVREGSLWGRGAADMLGAVAAFLRVAEARPDLDLGIALTTDEETGMGGARTLAASGLLRGFDACILGEPTGLRPGVGHKGVLWTRWTFRGRAAHASTPGEGENALRHLADALLRLEEVDLPGTHPHLGGTTRNPARVEGGGALNQVPDRAVLDLDCRFPPPVTHEDLRSALREALQDLPVKDEVLFALEPYEGDPQGPLARSVARALDEEGLPSAPAWLPFGTEAGRYREAVGDIVVLGPGDVTLAHTSEERVALEHLERAVAIYVRVAEAYQEDDPPTDRGNAAGGTPP